MIRSGGVTALVLAAGLVVAVACSDTTTLITSGDGGSSGTSGASGTSGDPANHGP